MKRQKTIIHIVGARPNFMKAAPVLKAFQRHSVRQILVHTGQHYGENMSDVFFKELRIAAPDVNLQVGSGTHAQQTAAVMTADGRTAERIAKDHLETFGSINTPHSADDSMRPSA